jgi:hypothetical protein
MKARILSVFLLLPVLSIMAQQAPEGFANGSITLAGGQTLTGPLKHNLAKKGTVTLLNAAGKKETYTAEQVQSLSLGGSRFVTIGYEFFEVLAEGSRMNLYRKASSAEGQIRYSGSEPVAVPVSEGRVGDYCITTPGNNQPQLVSKKNFEQRLMVVCADCAAVITGIKEGKLNIEQLPALAEQYNNCQ